MSIQSEINRINSNVQNTISTIADTGVAVPANANSDNLPALAAALANEKADMEHTHNYAGASSAGGAADYALKLQTYKETGSETYGTQYPLYAKWAGSILKLVCDGYKVQTDIATKATQDANGNVIADTYVTKANLITEVLAGLPQAEGVGF